MLIIPTLLRPSQIAGIGLFTPRPILKGRTICEANGTDFARSFLESDLQQMPDVAREHIETFGWQDADGLWQIEMDNGKFMNHSRNPNCKADSDGVVTSLRPVGVFEELTVDYRQFCTHCVRLNPAWL